MATSSIICLESKNRDWLVLYDQVGSYRLKKDQNAVAEVLYFLVGEQPLFWYMIKFDRPFNLLVIFTLHTFNLVNITF